MKKAIIILGTIIAVVLGLVCGYLWGYARGGAALTALYAPKIIAVGKLFPPAPTSMLSLSGQVAAINGSVITLDANYPTPNPFAVENFPAVRTVTVTSATVITKTEQITSVELQQEMQSYEKYLSSAPIMPPSPFIETSSTLSGIAVGDTVTVTAASDIMSAPSFIATAIQSQPML